MDWNRNCCGGVSRGGYRYESRGTNVGEGENGYEEEWGQTCPYCGMRQDSYAGYQEDRMPYGIRKQQQLQNQEMVRTLRGRAEEEAEEKAAANADPNFGSYYEEDRENERDRERLKSMYPENAREIMPFVEEECDRMEYEGSMMFDEYPDKRMLSRVSARIFDQVKENYEIVEGRDQDEAMAMNVETRRRYPPGKNWLRDLVDVMLYEEIYRRRCRRRRCGRRW